MEILGYKEVCEDFHKPLCKEIQEINQYFTGTPKDLPKQRLWLWARGHFKTTIISIAHTIQLILINPNIRILIAHNKLENAKGVLSAIKWHFMFNEDFRAIYPEYCPVPNKDGKIEWGTTEHITVPNRTQNYTEPTIDTAGVDTTKTGRHYDYMKKDDIVWEKSVTNEEQLKATNDWDALTVPMFDNAENAYQDYVGTRYHFADIYSKLLKTNIKKSVIPAWNEGGEIAFKSRFSKQGLESILKENQMSPYVFYCQYLLVPTDPDSQVFKEEWLEWRTGEHSPLWTYYVMVDPAGEKKQKADYTVMLVVGVDEAGKRHLVDGIRDKLHLSERIAKLKGLIEKWKPFRVSYERVGMQSDVQEIERLKMEGTFPYVTIDEIKLSPKETKNDRIRGLQGLFANHMITLPRQLVFYSTYHKEMQDLVEAFKYEFIQFPMCLKEDTFIKTDKGYKCIQDIKSEDMVFTHKQRYCKVKKLIKKPYKGDFYRFKGSGQLDLELSSDHKLYYISRDYSEYRNGDYKYYGWVEAKNWKKAYRNIIPIERFQRVNLPSYKLKGKMINVKNKSLLLDSNFAHILGYFLAEGNTYRNEKWSHKYICSFASHIKEEEKRHRVKRYLNKLNIKYKEIVDGNSSCIRFSSRILWELFSKCYDINREKIIPEYAYDMDENLYEVLDGWISGDGWGLKNRSIYDQYCGSTSKKLVLGMRDICLSRGWYASIQKMERNRYGKKTKDFYQLSIKYKNYESSYIQNTKNNEFMSNLKKSKPYFYEGDVYDLQVEDDNSFVANGFVIHNCEHDDILDTLSQITRVGVIKGTTIKSEQQKKTGETFEEAIRKIKMAKDIVYSDPYFMTTFEDAYNEVNRSS